MSYASTGGISNSDPLRSMTTSPHVRMGEQASRQRTGPSRPNAEGGDHSSVPAISVQNRSIRNGGILVGPGTLTGSPTANGVPLGAVRRATVCWNGTVPSLVSCCQDAGQREGGRTTSSAECDRVAGRGRRTSATIVPSGSALSGTSAL